GLATLAGQRIPRRPRHLRASCHTRRSREKKELEGSSGARNLLEPSVCRFVEGASTVPGRALPSKSHPYPTRKGGPSCSPNCLVFGSNCRLAGVRRIPGEHREPVCAWSLWKIGYSPRFLR